MFVLCKRQHISAASLSLEVLQHAVGLIVTDLPQYVMATNDVTLLKSSATLPPGSLFGPCK
jgi:hypothetical protein